MGLTLSSAAADHVHHHEDGHHHEKGRVEHMEWKTWPVFEKLDENAGACDVFWAFQAATERCEKDCETGRWEDGRFISDHAEWDRCGVECVKENLGTDEIEFEEHDEVGKECLEAAGTHWSHDLKEEHGASWYHNMWPYQIRDCAAEKCEDVANSHHHGNGHHHEDGHDHEAGHHHDKGHQHE